MYTSNTNSDAIETESGGNFMTDLKANKIVEKQCVVKRRFYLDEKFSVLFDFVETHDLCPIVSESVTIHLFHPKRSYTRDTAEGRLISDDITCDTVAWVEVTASY